MAQQTAVEWLSEKMEKLIPPGNQIAIYIMLEQAKQMEEQQIIEAWMDIDTAFERKCAEQYYKETYGK